jgi:hypothetical protein
VWQRVYWSKTTKKRKKKNGRTPIFSMKKLKVISVFKKSPPLHSCPTTTPFVMPNVFCAVRRVMAVNVEEPQER